MSVHVPNAWGVFWVINPKFAETVKNAKKASHRWFSSPEEAEAFKRQVQACGYTACVKPSFKAPKTLVRQSGGLGETWPLQVPPVTSK
jgi:hypothetical protein